MIEHTELEVYNITIQPMASSFMLKSGCYDHVYHASGAIQQFITKCVVGGRVMTNPNKLKLQTLALVLYTQVLCMLWKGL